MYLLQPPLTLLHLEAGGRERKGGRRSCPIFLYLFSSFILKQRERERERERETNRKEEEKDLLLLLPSLPSPATEAEQEASRRRMFSLCDPRIAVSAAPHRCQHMDALRGRDTSWPPCLFNHQLDPDASLVVSNVNGLMVVRDDLNAHPPCSCLLLRAHNLCHNKLNSSSSSAAASAFFT